VRLDVVISGSVPNQYTPALGNNTDNLEAALDGTSVTIESGDRCILVRSADGELCAVPIKDELSVSSLSGNITAPGSSKQTSLADETWAYWYFELDDPITIPNESPYNGNTLGVYTTTSDAHGTGVQILVECTDSGNAQTQFSADLVDSSNTPLFTERSLLGFLDYNMGSSGGGRTVDQLFGLPNPFVSAGDHTGEVTAAKLRIGVYPDGWDTAPDVTVTASNDIAVKILGWAAP
jgi:hypothetical protein